MYLSEDVERMKAVMASIKEDFSGFQTAIHLILERTNEISAFLSPLFSWITEENRKAVLEINKVFSSIFQAFEEAKANSKELFKPLSALSIFSKNQYVVWERIPPDFLEAVLNTDDIDSVLLKYEIKDNEKKISNVIDSCKKSKYIEKRDVLFSQTIDAYNSKNYALATIGICAIIDGVLTDASNNHITSISKRSKEILNQIKNSDRISDKDYSILSLEFTFYSMMNSFDAWADFELNEPKELNRHWIMHGRSTREISQLDFIKLLNFLYGIILIDEMSEENDAIYDESQENKITE